MGVKEEMEELKRKEEQKRQLMREQAIRAEQNRIRAAELREHKSKELLKELQTRWAAADKHVLDLTKSRQTKVSGIVEAWAGRRTSALERNRSSDDTHQKRMSDMWKTKQDRFAAWKKDVKEQRESRADEVAAARVALQERFDEELRQRNERLMLEQERAEERRLQMEEERAMQLALRAEEAERREQESWNARVRVAKEKEAYIAKIDAECKRKASQAEECLEKRKSQIEAIVRSHTAWRSF